MNICTRIRAITRRWFPFNREMSVMAVLDNEKEQQK